MSAGVFATQGQPLSMHISIDNNDYGRPRRPYLHGESARGHDFLKPFNEQLGTVVGSITSIARLWVISVVTWILEAQSS